MTQHQLNELLVGPVLPSGGITRFINGCLEAKTEANYEVFNAARPPKERIASLLEVGTGFQAELTGRENIYLNGAILGMNKAEITRKFDEMVDFSGVEQFIDTLVKDYLTIFKVRS